MRTAFALALLALAGGASANRHAAVVPVVPGVFTAAPTVVVQQPAVAVQPIVVPVRFFGRGERGVGGGLTRGRARISLSRPPSLSAAPSVSDALPPTHTPSHRNTKSLPSLCACLFFLHHLLKKKVAQPVVYQVAQPVYQPVVQQVVAPAPVVYAAPAAQQVVYAGEAGK